MIPVLDTDSAVLFSGDCREALADLPDQCVDAIITDPPYAGATRDYGQWSESEWFDLMHGVVTEGRRILKPQGSAVFILQPNSERVGRMRPWLFEFMAWVARDWNLIQDVWWWNPATVPTVHCQARHGLLRPSIKACVWAGPPDSYRKQTEILWSETDAMKAKRQSERALAKGRVSTASGFSTDIAKFGDSGFATPFNLIPVSNTNSRSSAGASGHGAGTPRALAEWWIRYITKPGDILCDPFSGSGTIGRAALDLGRRIVAAERVPDYVALSLDNLRVA